MTNRDYWIYALVGLSVWVNGAITFHLGGRFLFENGPLVTALVGVAIAVLVCLAFRATMGWRKTDAAYAVTVAILMALPGLFGEAARQLVFSWATGLKPGEAPVFDAVIFFGNAVLMTYALIKGRRAA
jgi:hypothetical protein